MTDNSPDMDEISPLDSLLILAESWVLILLGSIAAAVLAFILVSNQPKIYESTMLLSIPAVDAEAALNTNPAFAAIRSGFDFEAVPTSAGAGSAALGERTLVTFESPSVEMTEATITDFMNEILEPRVERARLPIQSELATIGKRIDELDTAAVSAAAALEETRSQPEIDFSAIAILLSLQQELVNERFQLEREAMNFQGVLDDLPQTVVVAVPSPAQQSAGRSTAQAAILAGMGAGFVLVLMAFLRHGLRNTAKDSENREKLQRIKNAFLFRRSAAN